MKIHRSAQNFVCTRVFILQKRAIRYIIGLKQTDSCQGSYTRLKNVNILYIYETVLFVREKGNRKINDTLPQYKILIELPSVRAQS
jgi:hypothetical protein